MPTSTALLAKSSEFQALAVQCGLGTEAEDLEEGTWVRGTGTAEVYMKLEDLEAMTLIL